MFSQLSSQAVIDGLRKNSPGLIAKTSEGKDSSSSEDDDYLTLGSELDEERKKHAAVVYRYEVKLEKKDEIIKDLQLKVEELQKALVCKVLDGKGRVFSK